MCSDCVGCTHDHVTYGKTEALEPATAELWPPGGGRAASAVAQHLPLLHHMLQGLLQAGKGRESEVMAHTVQFVGGLLPPALQTGISQWALKACQNTDCPVSHAAQAQQHDAAMRHSVGARGTIDVYFAACSSSQW